MSLTFEQAVCRWIEARGYKVMSRKSIPLDEPGEAFDLVAKKGGEIVAFFVALLPYWFDERDFEDPSDGSDTNHLRLPPSDFYEKQDRTRQIIAFNRCRSHFAFAPAECWRILGRTETGAALVHREDITCGECPRGVVDWSTAPERLRNSDSKDE